MKRSAPLLAAFLILLGAGLLHALWTDRWGLSPARAAAVQALDTVPLVLGPWDGRSLTLTSDELAIAEADGYVMREYVNRATADRVTLIIVCGRPGAVSVHPPEVCYRGAGYDQAGASVRYTHPAVPPATQAEFRVVDFRKSAAAAPAQLRVYYTWGQQGAWAAPERPRLAYALTLKRDPVLFKMYVVRARTGESTAVDKDPCVDFLQQLLPALQESLFASG